MMTFDKDITLQDLFTLLGEKIYMYSELTDYLNKMNKNKKKFLN